jgi:hypothetical protein
MCPVDHGYKLVRSKRFIPIILGAMLIASVVLWAGAGTAFGLAIHNKVYQTSRVLLNSRLNKSRK